MDEEAKYKREMRRRYVEASLFISQNLVGQTFDLPRSYGHATYKIIGGHSEWKTTQNATKIYAFVDEATGEWKFDYRSGACLCVGVIRLGGYNGPVETPFEQVFQLVKNILTGKEA